MTNREKACAVCGKLFFDTARSNLTKTCSPECKQTHRLTNRMQSHRRTRGTGTKRCKYCEKPTTHGNAKTCAEHRARHIADSARERRAAQRPDLPQCKYCTNKVRRAKTVTCSDTACVKQRKKEHSVTANAKRYSTPLGRLKALLTTHEWKARDDEKRKAYNREYFSRTEVQERQREHKRRYRKNAKARKNALARIYWFERQGRRCYLCGLEIKEENLHLYHLEHGRPVSKGGKFVTGLACPECNISKGSRTVEEYRKSDKSDPPGNALTRFPASGFEWRQIR